LTFEVIEREGKNYVLVNEDAFKQIQSPKMAKRDPNNKTRFVIIGGGPAGLGCAETLR